MSYLDVKNTYKICILIHCQLWRNSYVFAQPIFGSFVFVDRIALDPLKSIDVNFAPECYKGAVVLTPPPPK